MLQHSAQRWPSTRCGFRLAKVKVRCVGPQNYLECSWGKG